MWSAVRKRAKILVLLGLLAGLTGVYWGLSSRHTITLKEAVNPMFWVRRFRGEDLYDTERAILMHGNRSLPEVALTFDDGPHPGGREAVLDLLKKYGAHGTFFDVGRRIEERPDLVLRTLAEGHEIANHSMYHNRLPHMTRKSLHREVNDTDIAYYEVTGKHLTLFRPPGMQFNTAVLEDLKAKGYITVSYSAVGGDFDARNSSEVIVKRILNNTRNGAIILLHDYPPTIRALPIILEQLQRDGYRFVTISELIAHLPEVPRKAAEKMLSTP